MSNYLIIPALSTLVLFASFFVIWNEHRDKLPLYAKYYLAMNVAVSLWSLALMLTMMAKTPEAAYWPDILKNVMIALSTSLTLAFCASRVRAKFALNVRLVVAWLSAVVLIFTYIAAQGWITSEMVRANWGFWPVSNFGFYILIGYCLCVMSLTVFFAVKMAIQDISESRRSFGRLLLTSLIAPLVVGFGIDTSFRYFNIQFPPLTACFAAFSLAVMAYAIVKFKYFAPEMSSVVQETSNYLQSIMIAIDKTGNIVYANSTASSRLGRQDDLINRHISEVVDLNSSEQDLLAVPVRNEPIIAHSADGNELHLSLNSSEFKESSKKLMFYVLRELSQAEKIALQLKESTEELEERESALAELNHAAVQRELKIANLKKRLRELGEPI